MNAPTTPGAPGRQTAAGAPGTLRPRPRPARVEDIPEILRLVRDLADYERSLAEVSATEERLADLLFGANGPGGTPAAFCHVIDADAGPHLAGFALWYLTTSTWLAQHGIYLEDLYVTPEYRGRGYGQALMAELAGICVARGYERLEWSVLDWNTPAIEFYRSLGAVAMDEWTTHRISGEALTTLAAADGHPGA